MPKTAPLKTMFVACSSPDIARYWQYYAVDLGNRNGFYCWGCEYLWYNYPNESIRTLVEENSTFAYKDAMRRNSWTKSLKDDLEEKIKQDGFKAAMMLDWLVYQIDEKGHIQGKPFPLGNLLKEKT